MRITFPWWGGLRRMHWSYSELIVTKNSLLPRQQLMLFCVNYLPLRLGLTNESRELHKLELGIVNLVATGCNWSHCMLFWDVGWKQWLRLWLRAQSCQYLWRSKIKLSTLQLLTLYETIRTFTRKQSCLKTECHANKFLSIILKLCAK